MDEFLRDIHTSVLREWLKYYDYKNMQMHYDAHKDVIVITTKYSHSEIRFNDLNIIELEVRNTFHNETDFYIHFQMTTLKHALDLFEEFLAVIKSLIHKPRTKILLSCTSALTTSFFSEELNNACHLLRIPYHFDAVSFENLDQYAADYAMILLAPQIAYKQPAVQGAYGHKIVMSIPPAIFAKYDCALMIKMVQETFEAVNKAERQAIKLWEVTKEHGEILTLSIIRNSQRIHIGYRLFSPDNDVLEDNEIIKQNMSVNDIFDLIDALMTTHKHIDAVGLSTPGIINDGSIATMALGPIERIDNFESLFKQRYRQKLVLCNDVNAIAVGYHACQNQYHHISVLFQPISADSGVGHIINDELLIGHKATAGEMQFLPLDLSDSRFVLNKTYEGSIELITKELLAIISMVAPDKIVICNQFITDVKPIYEELQKYMPLEYIPHLSQITYVQDYSFIGTLLLCIRALYA